MTPVLPKTPMPRSPSDEWLAAVIARERARHARLEIRRQALGGVYDPILGRWVSVEETNAAQ